MTDQPPRPTGPSGPERPPTPAIDPAEVARRLEVVRARIVDAGGDPAAVTVLAVTKGFGPEAPLAAVAAGLTELGENYAQELVAKAAAVAAAVADGSAVPPRPLRWHFIGRLQRNKVRALAGLVHLWQTVDRAELATEIARRAPGAEVLLQVNVSDEPQKGGCPPGEVAGLHARAVDAGLVVRGLMTVGRTGPPEEARRGFAELARLADALDLPVRSMGMTGDLEAAVAEGSTMVRVGSALFGPRPSVHGDAGPTR